MKSDPSAYLCGHCDGDHRVLLERPFVLGVVANESPKGAIV